MKFVLLAVMTGFLSNSWGAEISTDCSAINDARGVVSKASTLKKIDAKTSRVTRK